MQPNSSDGEPDPQSESQPQPKSQASEPQEQQDKWFWEHTLYEELRKLAAYHLRREEPGQTLQATALVHEAYLRLVGNDQATGWTGRAHFFSAAAQAMQRILVDAARRKHRPKHGGDRQRVELDESFYVTSDRAQQLIALEGALEKLAAEAPVKAQLVQLRYFAGLSHQEAATALGISRTTADRYWAYAKAFLYCEVEDLADL